MNVSDTGPNQFDLQGDQVEVVYATTSITGEAIFSGTIRGRTVSASGDAIEAQASAIGTLVTVTTLASDRAGVSHRFSVILPHFRGAGPHELTTVGIVSEDREGSIHREPGPLEVYEAVAIKGIASTVQP